MFLFLAAIATRSMTKEKMIRQLVNHMKLQLSSYRKPFSVRNKMTLQFRLAESSDIDEVVRLSDGVYNGYDYLPVVFHQWLKKENVAIMMSLSGRKIVGLEACCIVDDGKTFIRRAGRILSEYRGHGLLRENHRALDGHVREHFPKVCRERVSSFADLTSISTIPYRLVLEQEMLSYIVEEKTFKHSKKPLNAEDAPVIESCTTKYFSDVILSPTMSKKLFPNNVLLYNWCPFEPLQSNVDLILREHDLHLFVDKRSLEPWPRSFSHGICAQRVKVVEWQTTVYTDDPYHFEAHLRRQFQCASELIQGKFTFVTFQDKSMTALARMVLEEKLQLNKTNVYNSKVFERDFT